MAVQLVDDVHTLWKRWSTRIAASQAGLVVFWLGLPHEWKQAIPDWIITGMVGVFALSFISAQSVKQPSLNSAPDDKKEGDKKDVA